MNLNELHENYKKLNPGDKIGLSKFCSLRPKHCITVGCRGTHSVCVCSIHQNVKLMVGALPTESTITYHELMEKLVCSVDSKICMLHRCPSCPGSESLFHFLYEACKLDKVSDEALINYKQWVTTDRTTLQDCSKTVIEFIKAIIDKINTLTSHHFIPKHQSRFLSTQKANLAADEAIIILDFAENYSFVIQDAAQGHHWDNSQATLHPFVLYYKTGDKVCHLSICIISDCLKHETITVHKFLNSIKSRED